MLAWFFGAAAGPYWCDWFRSHWSFPLDWWWANFFPPLKFHMNWSLMQSDHEPEMVSEGLRLEELVRFV